METFVVRIVDPAAGDTLRGVVQRVSDGSEHAFHGTEQLVELLRRAPVDAEDGRGR